MTLTKTPCELDTMSLFQDLKLKRRKVDSRCSSDGESVADTSTSSPDMTGPGSPCKLDVARSSPSPGIQRDRTASPDSVLPELTPKCEDRERTVKEEEEQCGDGGSGGEVKVKVKEEVNVSVFDGGGGGGGVGVGIGIGVGTSQSGGSSSNSNSGGVSSGGVLRRETVVTSSPAAMIPSPPTFWVSSATSPVIAACRINGVMPELIGGGVNYNTDTMKPPMSSPQRPASSGVRTTPTVIMGEAGGVRTMIWSQPSAEQPSQQIASTSTSCWSPSSSQSSTLSSGPGNSEETAAHLLLNLGQEQALRTHQAAFPVPLNMEKLWAGDLSQLPATQLPASQMQAINLSPTAPPPSSCWSPLLKNNGELQTKLPAAAAAPTHHQDDGDEEEQPMICMICEDKATGLHYGIITCEGCKGFFKRTVQNRRVYTCVADGVCEITKAQRNRCQYCRFKKCIEQGMVLQAVREDRMPGGRNSGAVYNLYKVKYKKHKKSPRNGQVKAQMEKQAKMTMSSEHGIPPHLVNGTILKTALTNPSEVVHLRQRLDNAVSSSRDRALPIDATLSMIQSLIDCDEFQDIATLQNLDDLLEHKTDLSDKLMQIGDSIVYKLVQWTKRLPFYLELPVEVHTRLLTHKWHELLVLTTSAYQAIHGANKLGSTSSDGTEADFTQEVSNNLCTLQTCLTSMMGRPITMDQLRQDVGLMVEKITHVTLMFRRIKLRMEEYVCLKVIIMLNPTRGGTSELETIQERYMTCLKTFVEHTAPTQPNRFHELLVRLPEVQSAASLLLDSKMFYVPFLLNSAIQR